MQIQHGIEPTFFFSKPFRNELVLKWFLKVERVSTKRPEPVNRPETIDCSVHEMYQIHHSTISSNTNISHSGKNSM